MNLLAQLASDTYINFLLSAVYARHGRHTFTSGIDIRHPASLALQRAVLNDDDLSQLFPGVRADDPPIHNVIYEGSSDVIWSNGSGGGLALSSIPSSLVRYVHVMASMDKTGRASLVTVAAEAIQRSRALARGDWTDLPHIVGIGNMTLGADIPSFSAAKSFIPCRWCALGHTRGGRE